MRFRNPKHYAMFVFVSVMWLLQSCSCSEPIDALLSEASLGYIRYETRYEPQPVLMSVDQDNWAIHRFDTTITCPTWSPNYNRLAYASYGNIYVKSMDRLPDVVVETGFSVLSAPVWSPQGNDLAFAAQNSSDLGGLDIWLLNLTTGDLQMIVECAESSSLIPSCSSPVWLPDGRLGYVRIGRTSDTTILSDIEVLDLALYKTEVLVTGLQIHRGWASFGVVEQFHYDHYSALSWSPDGSYIAFSGGSQHTGDDNIYLFDVSNEEISALLPSGMRVDTPVWLDNKHLVFRSITHPNLWEEGSYTEAYNIGVVNIHSKVITQLTDFTPLSGTGRNPVISCPFKIPRDIGKRLISP